MYLLNTLRPIYTGTETVVNVYLLNPFKAYIYGDGNCHRYYIYIYVFIKHIEAYIYGDGNCRNYYIYIYIY